MELRSRLFEMMTSGNAGGPRYPWFMAGTASRGKSVTRLIAVSGWIVLSVYVVGWLAATAAIWGWGFRSGVYSLEFAIMATLLVMAIVIAGLIRLACSRSDLPPGSQPR